MRSPRNHAGLAAALLAGTLLAAGGSLAPALAQVPEHGASATKPAAKSPARKAATAPAPAQPSPPPAGGGPEPDIVYGEFQRFHYLTAFSLATKRAGEG